MLGSRRQTLLHFLYLLQSHPDEIFVGDALVDEKILAFSMISEIFFMQYLFSTYRAKFIHYNF